jgi:hypothetical protein
LLAAAWLHFSTLTTSPSPPSFFSSSSLSQALAFANAQLLKQQQRCLAEAEVCGKRSAELTEKARTLRAKEKVAKEKAAEAKAAEAVAPAANAKQQQGNGGRKGKSLKAASALKAKKTTAEATIPEDAELTEHPEF